MGEWHGEDLRFTERIENKLGVTDYVSKVYRRGSTAVHLYVGFYASQQHGAMVHSPKNCLPGNGWFIARRDTTTVNVAPYDPFTANSYTVRNGIDQQVVVYWYQQSGGRIVTNEYLGRVHLVVDALTKGRSDAALIRISVPFEDDAAAAERTCSGVHSERLPGAGRIPSTRRRLIRFQCPHHSSLSTCHLPRTPRFR